MGAADFLVKPIRRNEVVTLWQHVWRSMQAFTRAGALPNPRLLIWVYFVTLTMSLLGRCAPFCQSYLEPPGVVFP